MESRAIELFLRRSYKLEMNLRVFLLSLLLFPLLASGAIFDIHRNKIPDREAKSTEVNWRKVSQGEFTGVATLRAPFLGDVCSAFLIDTEVSEASAYVLTNGHCAFFETLGVDSVRPGEVRVNRKTKLSVRFPQVPGAPVYPLLRSVYLTETETDVAIYALGMTLADLRAKGIVPLKLSSKSLGAREKLRLIGVPLLYVDAKDKVLHVSACEALYSVSLQNGEFLAPESIAHQCSSLPGLSGGPLITDSGEVKLLNSHGAADDSFFSSDCDYEIRPCELRPGRSPLVRLDMNYGQKVSGIRGCFNSAGIFDRDLNSCGLP